MKRLFAGMAAALLAAILLFSFEAAAISAESAILLDADTGRVLYEKQADQQSLIASTTKIMTALIVCEQCNVLDRVRIPDEAVGVEGSSIYLQTGEVLTVQELLYGLMLHSGNDAAVALAIYCGGTVEGFAQLMNDKAHRLGMNQTHFVNPHGLDSPNHYSTARDLAVLSAYAMKNPIFAQTVSTKTITMGHRILRNHNKLLWQVEGADGVKTGYTRAAGRILVSSATRDGRRLIAVTVNAPNDWADHASLLEKGFAQYSVVQVIQQGTIVGTRTVFGGQADTVEIVAAESFAYPASKEESVSTILNDNTFAYAPVSRGQDAGWAYIMVDDMVAGKIRLIYADTVEMQTDEEYSIWERFLKRGRI